MDASLSWATGEVPVPRVMPSTVRHLFRVADLDRHDCVRWGEWIPEQKGGVYAVALTDDIDAVPSLATAPISTAAIEELLGVRAELTLDGRRPSVDELAERLASFRSATRQWCMSGWRGHPCGRACATTTRPRLARVAHTPAAGS